MFIIYKYIILYQQITFKNSKKIGGGKNFWKEIGGVCQGYHFPNYELSFHISEARDRANKAYKDRENMESKLQRYELFCSLVDF